VPQRSTSSCARPVRRGCTHCHGVGRARQDGVTFCSVRLAIEAIEKAAAAIAREQGATVRQLAEAVGITERAANDRYRRSILADGEPLAVEIGMVTATWPMKVYHCTDGSTVALVDASSQLPHHRIGLPSVADRAYEELQHRHPGARMIEWWPDGPDEFRESTGKVSTNLVSAEQLRRLGIPV
jgi:hypothetical protein